MVDEAIQQKEVPADSVYKPVSLTEDCLRVHNLEQESYYIQKMVTDKGGFVTSGGRLRGLFQESKLHGGKKRGHQEIDDKGPKPNTKFVRQDEHHTSTKALLSPPFPVTDMDSEVHANQCAVSQSNPKDSSTQAEFPSQHVHLGGRSQSQMWHMGTPPQQPIHPPPPSQQTSYIQTNTAHFGIDDPSMGNQSNCRAPMMPMGIPYTTTMTGVTNPPGAGTQGAGADSLGVATDQQWINSSNVEADSQWTTYYHTQPGMALQ